MSYGLTDAGSTTTSAPARSASARRAAEKSAATTGPWPPAFNALITASPMGPQPTTRATSRAARRAVRTACTPTASGSVTAARAGSRPSGTGRRRAAWSTISSANPPGKFGVRPTSSGPSGPSMNGTEHTRVPAFGAPLVPGAGVEHLGAELVTEDHRRVGLGILDLHVEDVQIRTADAGGDRTDQHLPGARCGHVDLLDEQLAAVGDDGAHLSRPPAAPVPARRARPRTRRGPCRWP